MASTGIFIDGAEVTWADLSVAFDGSVCGTVQKFNHDIESKDEEIYGAGNEPLDIQGGNKAYSGTTTVLKNAYDKMTDVAIAKGGNDVTDIRWVISGVYRKQGVRGLRSVIFEGVKINKVSTGMAQGAVQEAADLSWKCVRILRG